MIEMSKSDDYFEDEDSGEDFSASEDEWKPSKYEMSSSESDDLENGSFEIEKPNKNARGTKRKKGNDVKNNTKKRKSSLPKTSAIFKKKINLSLREKLFQKYKPPPKTLSSPSPLNKSSSTLKSKINKKSVKNPCSDDDSDSSLGDHLVDINDVDLSNSFYNKRDDEECKKEDEIPDFDCNVGCISNSDDDDDDDKNDKEGVSKFEKFFTYNENLEKAKKVFNEIELKKVKKDDNKTIEKDEVSKLLEIGEGTSQTLKKSSKTKKIEKCSDSEWEDVDEIDQSSKNEGKSIDIYINTSDAIAKKEGVLSDFELAVRRRMNKIIKHNQLNLHKVNILCWIVHMNLVNQTLNDADLFKLILKTLPSKDSYPKNKTNKNYFEQIVKWYGRIISIENPSIKYPTEKNREPLLTSLKNQIQNKKALCKRDFVFIFVILIRALGIQCRLVYNLVTLPIRPSQDELWAMNSTRKPKQFTSNIKQTKPKTNSNKKIPQLDGNNDDDDDFMKPSTSKRMLRSRGNIVNTPVKTDVNILKKKKPINKEKVPETKKSIKNPSEKVVKKDTQQKPNKTKDPVKKDDNDKKRVAKKKKYDSDEDFVVVPAKITKLKSKNLEKKESKILTPKKIDNRVLSTDSEETVSVESNKNDYWVEVYSEENKLWIPIDLFKGKIDCMEDISKQATHPIVYVFAWNNDNTIKDITPRYCVNFHSTMRTKRVSDSWLKDTLKPYLGRFSERDKKEEKEFKEYLNKALPKSISEYKNHPMYALKRHLLKFEDIYPPSALILGYIRNEPVYPRDCVYTLHSREIWLKQARVVKLGEKPYKIVTSRPKWDKFSKSVIKGQPLEIFGIWQTQEYEPPTAENGIVPRNAYGNVELFKKCMLPKKTVHLQLNGLNRICKKLKIDCAPAVIGFDFHSGSSHPVYDGFVVCEEFAEIVTNAWVEEQEEIERKEKEKYEERVYTNWKKLIRGLLLREKLKSKYKF